MSILDSEKLSSATNVEKDCTADADATVSDASDESSRFRRDWGDEEEKKLVRKVDCIVMPLLILVLFSLQLDRGNIGNALTDFFLKDVGINQSQFNAGQQLLSVGIVVLMIPSNIVLYRIGPTVLISGQVVAWSLVATFQAFQKGLTAYLSTRLLLGLCESGFIPAGLYTITRWYKRDETSKRFSWFFIGNMLAQSASGLIAYGILHMRGVCGLAGWQWLFIIEGLLGLLVATLFILLFPKNTAKPVSLHRRRYFSERESQILYRRILLDDPTKQHSGRNVSKEELKRSLTNWKLLPHLIVNTAGLAPSSTMWNYAPSIVVGLHYERLKANAMVSIGQWLQLVLNVLWGVAADRWGKRGLMVTIGLLLWWGFALGYRLLIYSADAHARFAILTIAIAFSSIWCPVNGSWMALNAKSAGERSITMAIYVVSADTSGIIGSQLFQSSDAPLYRAGWSVIVAIVTLALVSSVVCNVQYRLLNRRQLKGRGVTGAEHKLYNL